MKDNYKKLIADEFRNCVLGTIRRVSRNEQTNRPFHTALLSEDVIFWSGFERSFSTSFGQRVIEELARLVALSNGADEAQRQRETRVKIDLAYEEAISAHMHGLRSNNRLQPYDWNSSISAILAANPVGKTVSMRIISDLWWRKGGIDHFISLKTVKPNIDQTAVAKEDCLHLKVALPHCETYFGLPYNPYGEKKESYCFNPPMVVFDFKRDPVVLVGKEMWDTIGGTGCYEELLAIAREVGKETKPAIDSMRKK